MTLVVGSRRDQATQNGIGLTTQTSATYATLTVTNSEPVIPDDEIQRLFRPFQRLAPNRDGHGLGFAIVNAVTQAHHATLTTGARPAVTRGTVSRSAPLCVKWLATERKPRDRP
jgi:signal transduction histidine kinase